MALITDIIDNIVPISDFSRGKASATFDRVSQSSVPVVVVKHNRPCAVIVSPEEYARLMELEEDLELLSVAIPRYERYKRGESKTFTMEEMMAEFGITQADLDAVDDVELEYEIVDSDIRK